MWRYKARRWKREMSTIKFQRPVIFDNRRREWKIDNVNVWRKLQRGPIDHRSSSQKLGKLWKLAGCVPHELSDDNKTESLQNLQQFVATKRGNSVPGESVTGDESWLLFKNVKERFAFRQVFHQRNTKRSPSTVRRQCGVWWNRSGIIHWEITLKGNPTEESTDSTVYRPSRQSIAEKLIREQTLRRLGGRCQRVRLPLRTANSSFMESTGCQVNGKQ